MSQTLYLKQKEGKCTIYSWLMSLMYLPSKLLINVRGLSHKKSVVPLLLKFVKYQGFVADPMKPNPQSFEISGLPDQASARSHDADENNFLKLLKFYQRVIVVLSDPY
jgi:hypothetical protein